MYPVDLPAVNDTDLTSASEQYLSSLESTPGNEWFQSQTSKVAITASSVRRLQLFEDDQPDCMLLALHPPMIQRKVQSIMERVIVFLLSQVVDRSSQEEEEVLFSLHPPTEKCKLLWRDSQAVGFYTVKHKGSLCDSWSTSCYLLPVLDTVLVRRSCRRRGFGLQMLEDFCSSFSTERFLGVSSPLSPSMVAVCRRFLQQHEEHQERLYDVEAPGDWTQRRNIWLSIQLGRYSLDINEESSLTSAETQRDEGDNSVHKMQIYNCRPDLTSFTTCNVNTPLARGSSEQQIKPSDPSQRGSSPSSETSRTGCDLAAHIDDLDSGHPTRPRQSLNTKRALKSKPSVSTEPHREEPEAEKTQRSAKRVRRT